MYGKRKVAVGIAAFVVLVLIFSAVAYFVGFNTIAAPALAGPHKEYPVGSLTMEEAHQLALTIEEQTKADVAGIYYGTDKITLVQITVPAISEEEIEVGDEEAKKTLTHIVETSIKNTALATADDTVFTRLLIVLVRTKPVYGPDDNGKWEKKLVWMMNTAIACSKETINAYAAGEVDLDTTLDSCEVTPLNSKAVDDGSLINWAGIGT